MHTCKTQKYKTQHSYWLEKFIQETQKKDGTEYPPKSLYGLTCCFKCCFETNERFDVNPLSHSDACFVGFRQTLDAEMKRLHKKGLGTKPKQAEPILLGAVLNFFELNLPNQ